MAERKDLIQDIQLTAASDLLGAVADMKTAGYRLGQACATKVDGGIEVLYSFEKDEALKNLKVSLGDNAPELQSISGIYWAAFIYENEMHDLFGITFKNLALDFGGHFFKIASETPWNPADKRSASDADAGAPAEVAAGAPAVAGADSGADGGEKVTDLEKNDKETPAKADEKGGEA
ncbi:MAG: NADH-quinone oxidoreductase subunit C [Clostridiales Family XIII bacterium]|jgi:ech hydrogenase subunit D|nr:NADH-quinone oxidoreductase subunit C [Clostridiales Family XIII bacterium]